MFIALGSAEAASPAIAPRRYMRRYIVAMAIGAILMAAMMVGTAAFLHSRNALPPPQFSNSICIDEKLRIMREMPPQSPNLLVVGSSVAWRHFNSTAAMAFDASLRPYNAGLCGQAINQTTETTRWLLGRLPSVRHVMLLASPLDFEDCASEANNLNFSDVDAYVFGGQSAWRYYLRYFDPVTFLSNAHGLAARRSDAGSFGTLVIDRFGDGPMEPRHDRGMFYKEMGSHDPACFAALGQLAALTGAQGQTLDVVLTPVSPDWVQLYDPERQKLGQLQDSIRRASKRSGIRFIDMHDAFSDEQQFVDAIHLRWSATAEFTRAIL